MMRNNPDDVVFGAFSELFFRSAIRTFQRDNEMKNIVMTDPQIREQITRHFFKRAKRRINDEPDANAA
ncbi:MAG: hypothetical protein E6R12_10420 [Sphingomonadales bacterium]|nr:MAG: hypothetical protein E6R12_10420 [Sphingomonadales bacterium]